MSEHAERDWADVVDLTLGMMREPMTLQDARDARDFLTSYVVWRRQEILRARSAAVPQPEEPRP